MESECQTEMVTAIAPTAMITARLPESDPPADGSAATSGLSPGAGLAKSAPEQCSDEQLVEIVLGVARRFRAARDAVSEHRDYILRLKAEVFKVRFGSEGVRVAVTWRGKSGRTASRKLLWKEFCEVQFGVSADWIGRVCGGAGLEGGPGQAGLRARPVRRSMRRRPRLRAGGRSLPKRWRPSRRTEGRKRGRRAGRPAGPLAGSRRFRTPAGRPAWRLPSSP